jgi:hypothetical protein
MIASGNRVGNSAESEIERRRRSRSLGVVVKEVLAKRCINKYS